MEILDLKREDKSKILKKLIRDAILKGEYRTGDKIPTEDELCRTYNISRTTVREALAGLVSEGLLDRKVGVGTFVSENTIKLKIGILPVGFTDSATFANDYLYGKATFFMVDKLQGIGYTAIVLKNRSLDEFELPLEDDEDVDGFILMTRNVFNQQQIDRLYSMDKKFVLFNRSFPADPTIPRVVMNNEEVAKDLLIRAYASSYKNFLIIHSDVQSNHEKMKGFREAKAFLNIKDESYNERLTDYTNSVIATYKGFNISYEYLKSGKHSPLIICTEDEAAIGSLLAARSLNFNMPDDVGVLGMDGFRVFEEITPHFAGVKYPIREMSDKAVEMIDNLVKSQPIHDPHQVAKARYLKGETFKIDLPV